MSILQFAEDARKDLESPSSSAFPSKMAAYRNMVSSLDEVLDVDRNTLHKFKKSVKGMHTTASAYASNELTYAENMEKLGSVALSREAETGIGTAFLKFSVITKELCQMTKILCGNYYNMVLFPLDSLLKNDMKALNEFKRPFDDSWKELKAKGTKVEKEARKKTQEIVLYRIDPPEASEFTGKERKTFMLQSCEYLIKANEVKVKKGVELVQHLIEYYHAQLQYFHRGMELLEDMRSYFEGLAAELQQLKATQDDERHVLIDLRNLLKTSLQSDRTESEKKPVYSLHGQQGDKDFGMDKRGTLLKRSEGTASSGKMSTSDVAERYQQRIMNLFACVRKQWQKRFIVVKNGKFTISHSSTSNRNVTINLLTCQVKPAAEKDAKKNAFALVTQNRTYLFQAEDENDYEAWVSVISNAREESLKKAFGDGDDSLSKDSSSVARNLKELTESIISEVQKLPENDICVDCGAPDPTWFSTNLGVLVCIECSGIHREMGVHISRIRSLTLDKLGTAELLLAKAIGNGGFNEIMEAELDFSFKPIQTSKMEKKKEFINAKYLLRKFVHKSESSPESLLQDLSHAITNRDILAVLQLYAEGVDLAKQIPENKFSGTALHIAVHQEDLTSLHLVDFLVQNSSNIDTLNSDGNTALHLASCMNKQECVKLLLRGGANRHAVNNDGKTPIAIAEINEFTEIKEIFFEVDQGKIQKVDNVKIDWGIDQADGIYENPLDLLNFKMEPTENSDNSAEKVNSCLPYSQNSQKATSATLKRSESMNSPPHSGSLSKPATNNVESSLLSCPVGKSTPAAVLISGNSDKAAISPTDNAPSQLPPPPPARKSMRQKGPQLQTQTNKLDAVKVDTVIPGSVGCGVLSTFAAKPLTSSYLQHQERSPPPPAPPARTTSSMPRPDRPAAPPLWFQKHQRNASDGDVVDVLNSVSKEKHLKKKSLGRIDSVPTSLPRDSEGRPPPLPPPRPKGPPDSSLAEISPATPPRVPLEEKSKEISETTIRRARALYDCVADHDDELEFHEGDTIFIYGEADPEWLFGEVEGKPGKRGVFPINFVHVLNS